MIKPMLAANADLSKLKFPVYASPKLDGIRCLIIDGRPVTRTLKPIPNKYIREQLTDYPNLDGEIIVGKTFQETSSAVMSFEGQPDFTYFVFDLIGIGTYEERWLSKDYSKLKHIKNVIQILIPDQDHLEEYEDECLLKGHEGIMLRSPDGLYKFGRSTVNEGYLLKLKRFDDSEAMIIGFEEQLKNCNEATIDELGHTKRSTHQENKHGKNTLGKFIVKEIGNTAWKGKIFYIGTGEGLTNDLRQEIWNHQSKYLGIIITYKYQNYGIKDLPRLPIFKGFRSSDDM